MTARWTFWVITFAILAGCTAFQAQDRARASDQTGSTAFDRVLRPVARPSSDAPPTNAPPTNARTAEEFDTTTAADRVAAIGAPVPGEVALGRTIASLGSPVDPGFWIKTTLVDREQPGRVVYPINGKSVRVTLLPVEGLPTAGSRLSLAAFRLLDAPMTGLPEILVFAEAR